MSLHGPAGDQIRTAEIDRAHSQGYFGLRLVIQAPGFRSRDLQARKTLPRDPSSCLHSVWDGDGARSRLVGCGHSTPDGSTLPPAAASAPGIPGNLTSSVNGNTVNTHVEPMAINALRHGADDHLRKRVRPAEFQAALDRTISRLRLARHNVALRRPLAARGASLAAFDGRCISTPPQRGCRVGDPGTGCVAPRSNTPGILGRRALPSGRRAPGLMPRSTVTGH